jgi:hypothetical protein
MAGIQDIPHIIPEKWSAQWFRTFIAEVLAKLDTRNSIGVGITVDSDGNSVATLDLGTSVSDAIDAHDALDDAHTAAFDAHVALPDPHTQYATDTDLSDHVDDTTDVHAAADYAQTDVTETISVPWYFADNIVMPKTSGKGIQLEPAAPTFGWRDIIGQPQEPTVGSGKPSWVQIASSGVYTWSFATADIQYYQFHIPHDYVPGSAVHFHVHWFSSTTAGASTRWTFDYLYAKGHQQAAFPTTAASTFAQQVQVTTAYTHMIAESAAETISGLEVDGLILVKVSRVAPTGGPSDVAGSVFVPCIDLHYQSTNLATKQKAPPFWT